MTVLWLTMLSPLVALTFLLGMERFEAWILAAAGQRGTSSRYGPRMRFLWAALATAPFVTVAVGMVTGRVRARSCCVLPAEDDARLRPAQREDSR